MKSGLPLPGANIVNNALKGSIIAGAVAGLFACAGSSGSTTSATPATGGGEVVNCAGINSCSGQGSCAGAENACKAQNGCKGKGWVETTEEDCTDQGGTIVAS